MTTGRAAHRGLALALALAGGCDGETPTDEDCADGEVWVEDACLACGPAGGCDSQGPACRPACDTCPDGYEPLLCI